MWSTPQSAALNLYSSIPRYPTCNAVDNELDGLANDLRVLYALHLAYNALRHQLAALATGHSHSSYRASYEPIFADSIPRPLQSDGQTKTKELERRYKQRLFALAGMTRLPSLVGGSRSCSTAYAAFALRLSWSLKSTFLRNFSSDTRPGGHIAIWACNGEDGPQATIRERGASFFFSSESSPRTTTSPRLDLLIGAACRASTLSKATCDTSDGYWPDIEKSSASSESSPILPASYSLSLKDWTGGTLPRWKGYQRFGRLDREEVPHLTGHDSFGTVFLMLLRPDLAELPCEIGPQ
ncbi:hypothetical protein C8F01DRAFT_1258235 [Mycena amicta]|nr:hypothetical protein C8F01DRAFT_1258235 [Mycena amicta]